MNNTLHFQKPHPHQNHHNDSQTPTINHLPPHAHLNLSQIAYSIRISSRLYSPDQFPWRDLNPWQEANVIQSRHMIDMSAPSDVQQIQFFISTF